MDNRTVGENALAILRIMMGWMMLWGFLDKLIGLGFETPAESGVIDGGSPSSFVTFVTGGIFSDFFNSLAGNAFADLLMMAGLLILGITLILGIASKLTTIGMIAFLVIMYALHVPPVDNPVIDYHITWIAALIGILFLGGFDRISVNAEWKELWIVKRYPILE